MSQHTLSVLVENKPGVLVRIAGLFSRRGFNIDSLAVGPTEHEEISRMTIVVNCDEHPLEQVTKQLNKLVNVLKIVELEPSQAVQRELALERLTVAELGDAQHVHELVHLLLDLVERALVAVDDESDPRAVVALRRADRERVDVEAAPREHVRDPRERARLVLD